MSVPPEISKKAAKGYQWATCSSSSVIINLPSYILMEILCRLPIKNLMASKCVCKSWLHLISDPGFAKLYSTRVPIEILLRCSMHEIFSTNLFMGTIRQDDYVTGMKLDTLFVLPRFSVRSNNALHFNVKNFRNIKNNAVQLVNTCHGLICFCGSTNKYAAICNPITGEFITIPAPRVNKGLSECSAYGFGFSQRANRYKLLRVMRLKEIDAITGQESFEKVVEICTFEQGSSWRNVGHFPYSIFMTLHPVFFEGTLHWVCEESGRSDLVIVSFDFNNEKLGEVPHPPHFDKIEKNRNGEFDLKIGVLGGCFILTDLTKRGRVDIWAMKEYGVQDSWTITFSIKTDSSYMEINEPIKYLDNGELLILRGPSLYVYNPVLQSIRGKQIADFSSKGEVIAYSPSPILLKDAMMGYNAQVLNVKSRDDYLELKQRAISMLLYWFSSTYNKELTEYRVQIHFEETEEKTKLHFEEMKKNMIQDFEQMEQHMVNDPEMKRYFEGMDVQKFKQEVQGQADLMKKEMEANYHAVMMQFKKKIKSTFDELLL